MFIDRVIETLFLNWVAIGSEDMGTASCLKVNLVLSQKLLSNQPKLREIENSEPQFLIFYPKGTKILGYLEPTYMSKIIF